MDNNVKVNINVTSNGTTDRETKKAKELHTALDQAARAAGRVGTAGSKAVAAKALPPTDRPTSQSFMAAEVQQYGQQRGAAGMTGASARDFANQAQGLGGLVRLYATYAANVFAVGMAFRALSTAMDTTNMIRGLDQIGAASGVALGGLSKQLVSATGGAISLREAMSATAKVTQAGLGQENVLRLGQVAAKASQALGVDMTDAISRLSRGITKLEPELLDELGIFTKIDPAVEKYALRVGKAASQLTDFERRQAFANAVLEEGEKKFAAIEIDANPYNKLSASLANIAQQGLELVNKVLAPIIGFLSQSPTALITALVGVAGAIIKQAVPAFGAFRENIRQANQEANEAAQNRARQAIAAQRDLNSKLLDLTEVRAEKEVKALDDAEARFTELRKKGVASKAVTQILQPSDGQAIDTLDITEKQIQTIEKAALAAKKKGLKEEAQVYDDLAVSIRNGQKAEQDYLDTKAKTSQELQKSVQSYRTIIGLNRALAESAEKASFKQQVASNAAYAGSLIGPINAIKLMRAEISANTVGLGKYSVMLLTARGALAAFAGAAATVGTVLMSAFGVITAIIGVGSILVSLFTKTAKETQATDAAFSQLEESTKNLSNTIDVINKKPYLEQFTAESINARANALEGFVVALEKTNQASQKELATMGLLDTAVDVVKMLWDGDVRSKLTKEMAFGLAQAFKDAQNSSSEAGKAAKQTISNLLRIDPGQLTDFDKLNEAFDKLSGSEAAFAVAQITGELEKLSKSTRTSATALQGVQEAFKKVGEARQKFTQGLVPTDSFTELGSSLVSASFELENALRNPETRLQSIKTLLDELKNIGGVDTANLVQISGFVEQAEQVQVLNSSLANTGLRIEELTAKQKELNEVSKTASVRLVSSRRESVKKELEDITREIETLQKYSDTTLNVKLNLESSIKAAEDSINKGQAEVFKAGADIVANKLSAEFAKAEQTITNAFASLLTGTEAGIRLRADAEKAMLAVQRQQIKTQEDQIIAIANNTLSLKEATLSRKREELTLTTDPDTARVVQKEIADLTQQISGLKLALSPEGSYANLAKQRTADLRSGQQGIVTEDILKLSASLEASRAAAANINAQGFAVELKLQDDLLKISQKRGVEDRQRDIQSLKAARDLAVANESVFNQTNTIAILERQRLDTQLRQEEETLRQLTALNTIEALEFARDKISKSQLANRQKILGVLEKDIDRLKEANAADTAAANLREQIQLQKNEKELIEANAKLTLESLDTQAVAAQRLLDQRTQDLSAQQKSFELLTQTIELSPEFVAQQQEILAKKQAQLEFDRQQQQLDQTRLKALAEQDALREKVFTSVDPAQGFTEQELAELARIADKRREINATFEAGLLLQARSLGTSFAEADAKKRVTDEQNRYNRLLQETSSVGASLSGVFAGLGESADKFSQGIEAAVTAFAELEIQTAKNAKTVKTLEEALANPEASPEERASIEKEIGKAKEKQTKDELSGNIKLVSSAKALFKEKTAAYKILAAMEKAMFIAKLAMDAKTLASTVATQTGETAATQAGFFARAGTYVTEIFGKITSQLGVFGPAVAAAIIAAIGLAAWSKGGGKGGSTPTAQQRQEVQGSAIGYNAEGKIEKDDQGNPITYRRGILGDPTAKSQLIDKSLELLADNSVDNLTVNNKMLAALYKIEAGIRGVSAGIVSIPGLTIGSLFNTKTGSSGTSFLGGLFGSKTTREIIDSGLKFRGTIEELSKDALNLVSVFETVQTTRKRSFAGFSRTKSSVSTEEDTLAERGTPQARRLALALEKTFAGIGDLLVEAAEASGVGGSVAKAVIGDLANRLPAELQTFSTRGLKPDEVGPAFQAYLGSVSDFLGFKIFGTMFDEFALAGEELVQTVLRVVRTNEVVGQSFANLGLEDFNDKVKRFTGLTGVDLTLAVADSTQAMVDLAGGVDKFAERMQFIADNFVGEDQKLAVTQRRLSTDLAKTGLIDTSLPENQRFNITTREEYIRVLDQINDAVARNVPGALELQNEFSNLSTVYDQLLPPLKASTEQIKEYTESITQQTSRIQKQIELLGATDYARTLNGITESFEDAIKTLDQQGMLTLDTLNLAYAQAQAQKALLDAQNAAKASDLVTGLNAEVAAMSLGAVGKELLGITNKARDYAEQLINLNQATDENLAAIRAWEAAMIEAARNTRREAQATQYAQLFSANQSDALAQKFAKLGFSLPSNIQQLKFIVDGIDATTDAGLELRGKLLDLGSEFKSLVDSASSALRSAYDARVQELKGAQDQFKNFAKSIRDFRQSLLTGAQSPLTPIGKYEQTKMEFERIAALASGGDIKAMEQLQSVSSSFLEASREVYASSELYTQDFNRVLAVIDTTASVAERQIEVAENTLMEIRAVVGGLIDIAELTDSGNVILTGLGPKLQQAIGDFTAITSAVDVAILQSQIDMANASNAQLGNVTSGVDQVRISTDSSTDAINNLTNLYYNTQAEIRQRDLDINNQSILNTNAIIWTLNQNNSTLLDALAPKPQPAAATPEAAMPIYPTYFGTNMYYDQGAANGAAAEGYAKGGAFWNGVEMFARGGIVDSPTLFKFAKGTGLMGEAGPEAIMPLRRDGKGNLGVIAQQTNDELLAEIAKLNAQVQQLTQVVAQGAVINAQATDRNTEAITTTIQTTATDKQYMKKVQSRTSIV